MKTNGYEIYGRKDEELKSKLPELYAKRMSQNYQQREDWLMCAAFVKGLHYTVKTARSGRLLSPKPVAGRKRIKINRIGSWHKHAMAKIVLAQPEFDVVPPRTDYESLSASQAASAYLNENAASQRWLIKRHEIINYMLTFGNCFGYIRDYVDKRRMTAVRAMDAYNEPIIDPETGRQAVTFEPMEDVGYEILLPHNVLCDNEPTDINDKRDFILCFRRSMDYFRIQYGAKGEKVKPESSNGHNSFDLELLSQTRDHKFVGEFATEMVYLRPPNGQDDKGMMAIYAGGEVLVNEPWMYDGLSDINLVHFRHNPPPPGEFWSTPPVLDQIPIQKAMNEVASIIQENIANVGHIKWFNPNGSGVTTIDDLSGEIINHTPGLAPVQGQVATLPHYEVSHLLTLSKMLEDVQNFHGVSRGAGTPNVRSRNGLDKLEELDDTPLGVVDTMLLDGYQELAEKVLKIAAEKLTTPRLVSVVGEGRRRGIVDFVGQMLEDRGKVKVRMVDSFLRSKAATQQLVMEMFQQGMITDDFGRPDTMAAQKMLQFALPDMMWDGKDTQREMQMDENDQLIAGQVVAVEEWQNHMVHLEVVEEMLNGAEWRAIAKESKEIREVCLEHRQMHLQFVARAMGGGEQRQTEQTGEQTQT